MDDMFQGFKPSFSGPSTQAPYLDVITIGSSQVVVSSSEKEEENAMQIEPVAIPQLHHTGISIGGEAKSGDDALSGCFYSNGKKSKMMQEKIRKILQGIDEREANAVQVMQSKLPKANHKRQRRPKLRQQQQQQQQQLMCSTKQRNTMLLARHRSRATEKSAEALIRTLRSEATTQQQMFKYL